MRIKESMGNIKMHWTMVREVTDKTNNKEDITTSFHYEGRWVENAHENAENFNKYLANIGKETNENVGNPKNPAQHYLTKHSQMNQNSLLLSDVSSQDILDACKKFTPKTSTDPNGFQQSIVLQDVNLLAPVLAHLVNCSQRSGIFPENGKIARVIQSTKTKEGNTYMRTTDQFLYCQFFQK